MDRTRKDKIVTALATLLRGVAVEAAQQTQEAREMRVYTAAELVAAPIEPSILRDPVGTALRLGIRNIGTILNAEGGSELMEAICDEVGSLPEFAGTSTPAVIIDHAWDGIGGWYA